MLDLRDIHKVYRVGPTAVEVLKGISLTIEPGELVSITGTSGCGKSTLMNIIGLLDRPSSGEYHLDGSRVAYADDDRLSEIRNRRIGFVFQQYQLLSRLTALANVLLPLVYRPEPTPDAERRGLAMLERVGMAERAHHKPTELSGGQQQRVAIARALVGQPTLILADEPTGALDTRVGQEIMDLFRQLNRDDQITVVIITHDPGLARQCDRVITLRDGLLVP
ncbi:MAG: ABC transporter ATP-binding protein [Gammaproteobacteria bacterium]|nr:ABC transporter ATP-binding protein [Gammaproteobacteria bacterium]